MDNHGIENAASQSQSAHRSHSFSTYDSEISRLENLLKNNDDRSIWKMIDWKGSIVSDNLMTGNCPSNFEMITGQFVF